MNDTLFDLARSLSPRLQWKRKYKLRTQTFTDVDDAVCHVAFAPEDRDYPDCCGEGPTEDDALVDWAKKHGKLTWLEEGGPI